MIKRRNLVNITSQLFFIAFGCVSFLLLKPNFSHASCSVTSIESGKPIRACQVEDLRSLINQARSACFNNPIAPYAFSDDPLLPGQTAISIRHLNEMKAAINEISTICVPTRTPLTFTSVLAGDIISVRDFVNVYNVFVSTTFCGDGICQTGEEDLTTCSVDCGGTAEFYCNNLGGCYAAVLCPIGKRCYSTLQGCQANAPTDCAQCVSDCSCASNICQGGTCSDGCGGLCPGTKVPDCSCASTTCEGASCADSCGATCPGTLQPSCAGAEFFLTCQTFSDGCGGTCTGTRVASCRCAQNTCVGQTCINRCGVECAGTMQPDCSCSSNTCIGDSCSDGCGGTCAGTRSPDCSCSSATCWDDMCDNGCSGACVGTSATCSPKVQQHCNDNATAWLYACGNNPTIDGYYYYRCSGNCIPTDTDKVSGLVSNCTEWADTTVVMGQTYSYSAKFYNIATDTYSPFSPVTTYTVGPAPVPDCSCAANTCPGDTCSDGCGGSCAGSMPQDCSCASNTCLGDTCSDTCGGTCAGTMQPDCTCAVDTCIGSTCQAPNCSVVCNGTMDCSLCTPDCSCSGQTCTGSSCSDGCGGTCAGSKDCTCVSDCSCESNTCQGSTCSDGCGGVCNGTKDCHPTFDPIECKKWSCSGSGFCLQNYTATCSCPAGKKPVCVGASPISCGSGNCPDTKCECVD